MIKTLRELIESLCDGDNRHPMADKVTIEMAQKMHELTKVDTGNYGIREVIETSEEVIH